MSMFLTRVVLHDVDDHDGEEYEKLHVAMENKGFSRTIDDSGGKTYHLPPAEYYRAGDVTGEQVRADAKAAASTVQSNFSVLVTVATSFLWSKLEPLA